MTWFQWIVLVVLFAAVARAAIEVYWTRRKNTPDRFARSTWIRYNKGMDAPYDESRFIVSQQRSEDIHRIMKAARNR